MRATMHGVWDFSETEWSAIDKAVRDVYYKNRSRLPAHWQGTPSDPAGELRSWVYEYAATHAQEVHSRCDWQITHLLRSRAQQFLSRSTARYREVPYGIGRQFEWNTTKALGRPGSLPVAPGNRDPYADALEPYKRLLTPSKRRALWHLMNPGTPGATTQPDPTGDSATENIYLEHLQYVLANQLFHPSSNCKCEECVNIIPMAA